jgi:hypothetical protein
MARWSRQMSRTWACRTRCASGGILVVLHDSAALPVRQLSVQSHAAGYGHRLHTSCQPVAALARNCIIFPNNHHPACPCLPRCVQELGIYGRLRKISRCGPLSMFRHVGLLATAASGSEHEGLRSGDLLDYAERLYCALNLIPGVASPLHPPAGRCWGNGGSSTPPPRWPKRSSTSSSEA